MMNIYDCFMYFDEDLLLDLRLNSLNSFVKKFVITEATYTHNGKKKKLRFDINNFKKFKDKIIYIVVDKQPDNILKIDAEEPKHKKGEKLILNGMARDYFQRENLSRGLKNINDEVGINFIEIKKIDVNSMIANDIKILKINDSKSELIIAKNGKIKNKKFFLDEVKVFDIVENKLRFLLFTIR